MSFNFNLKSFLLGFALAMLFVADFTGSYFLSKRYLVPNIEAYKWQTTGEFTKVKDVENNIFAYIREDPSIPMVIPYPKVMDNHATIFLYYPQGGETLSMTRYYLGWAPTSEGLYLSFISKPGLSFPAMLIHNINWSLNQLSLIVVSLIIKVALWAL